MNAFELARLLAEANRDIADALAGRLFTTCDPDTDESRTWRRRPGWKPRKGTSRRPLCGAKTRKGTPCQAAAVSGRAKCKCHGGASTGPKTAEGRARIAESNRRRRLVRLVLIMDIYKTIAPCSFERGPRRR
jgi:hypothetical protein